ncbi:hypothetical protein C7271_08740 [filamentous cyanobacterium CCP5]|nr:hypothetical protein C7271_08740 [filamentous cyanobacterium CCP5]
MRRAIELREGDGSDFDSIPAFALRGAGMAKVAQLCLKQRAVCLKQRPVIVKVAQLLKRSVTLLKM